MIPRKVHYCWFGQSKKNKKALKCINSWKKYCPDFEVIEWNETNFDINYNAYTKFCYDNKQWAFLSDYVRLVVVAEQGGLYFDTDVEVIRTPEELLKYQAFFSFENSDCINTGQGFGSEANHPIILAMKTRYEELEADELGEYPLIRCPELNTEALKPFGLILNGKRQNVAGAEILPVDYMNPYDDATGRLKKTENTLSIHWYSKSWLDHRTVLRSKITKPFHRIFGKDCFAFVKKMRK